MKPGELFQQAKLTEAIQASVEEVKNAPGDRGKRTLLCELLCFAGDLERADKHLDLLMQPDAQDMAYIAAFRQLLRAEMSRREFFEQGRPPEVLSIPDDVTKLSIKASVHLRAGENAEAGLLLQEAEKARIAPKGTCNGKSFSDFRDLDDLLAGTLEVLTATGKYYWIPMSSVISLEVQAPQRPRDLLWLPVILEVKDGPEGNVWIPTTYPGSHKATDDAIRLGRATDWTEDNGAPVRGLGLKEYLVGEDVASIFECKVIQAVDS